MKKFYLFIFLVLLILNLIGQDCTVKITYAINKTNPPSYTFKSDFVGENAKYYWYFGDNTTSDNPLPTHSYKVTNTYQVDLKILRSDNKVCYGKLLEKFEGAVSTTTDPVILAGKGKVVKSEVSTCGLLIYLENGTILNPVEMVPNFLLKEGQYVELAYEFINKSTICMAGKTARIQKIAEITITPQPTDCAFDLISKPKADSPNTIIFYTVSKSEIKSLKWSFGDGQVSESKEAVHTYEKAGTYEVICTLVASTGCTLTKTVKITVPLSNTTTCRAYFTATNQLWSDPAMMKKVVFSNQSTGEIRECQWSFGDGTTSNELKPVHEYKEFGDYKVCLIIATTTGCKSDYCATVKVASGQTNTSTTTCGFDLIAKPKETANTFVFYAISKTTIKTIKWNLGDGTTSDKNEFVYTYAKTGIYEVTCTVTTAENCTATRSIRLTVTPPPLPACKGAITLTLYDPTGSLCNGEAKVSLLDEKGGSVQNVKYQWSNGSTSDLAKGLCPDKAYTVTAMIENNCQKSTSFTFLAKPVWRLTTSDGKFGFEVIDPKTDLTYKWDFGDGNTATGSSVNYSFQKDGVYNVKLTVVGEGSSADFNQEVSVLKSISSVREIKENEFRLFPNPAKDKIRIDFGILRNGKLLIEAIDIRGQKAFIQQLQVDGHHLVDLDIHQLPAGIYIMKITNENQVLQSRKFIVKD